MMSLSTFDTDQPLKPVPAEDPPPIPARVRGNDSPSLSWQPSVIRGMLSTLDTLTAAGQHHVMSKIIRYLGHEATHARRSLSHGNQHAFAELLGHLTEESERLWPDIRAFSRRVEGLMALLAAIG
jgi:hypothetical protein